MIGDLFLTRASRYLSPGGGAGGVVGGLSEDFLIMAIKSLFAASGERWGRRILNSCHSK